MKQTKLLILTVLMLVITASACKKEKDEPATLSVSPTSLSFEPEKSSATIQVASNTAWRITGKPSWVTISPSNGKNNETVEVTCDENTKIEERTGSFIVISSDGSIEETVEIRQSGKEVTLSVDVTSINLSSIAHASQSINIKCNSAWTLSGNPEWLQVSSNSGNGNSNIVISARSSNDSSKPRTATLTINSEGKSVIVTVEQEAGLSSCISTPSNITTLYYAVIFNLTYSSEVATTKLLMLSDYDFKHKTESELIREIEKEDAQIPESETIYTRGVDANEKYHILSLSYDRKGNRGELVDVEFQSPSYLNATDDAWCVIEDAGVSPSLFMFSVVKKGRCATYDVIYGANIYPGYLSGALMAFEINYYTLNNKKNWLAEKNDLNIETFYPNDHTFYCDYSTNYYYGGVIATTWGRFSDGTRSSDIDSVYGDTYSQEVISSNGEKDEISAVEWIRNQKGWIKTVPGDFEK